MMRHALLSLSCVEPNPAVRVGQFLQDFTHEKHQLLYRPFKKLTQTKN
jgi:hypothetical protein